MKTYQKLNRFPLGAIHAEGFLKQQMEIGKNGMTGHLYELEPDMIATPYINKAHVDAWTDAEQSGWGGEISGNYWTGYIEAAYTLNDPEMIKRAEKWVNEMMKHQKADGYLGTYYEEDALIYDDYNAWGTAGAMRALLAFYEATGREDVLEAVHRCMLWFCNTWSGNKKTCYAGEYIIEPMVFAYYYTGDTCLIEFAEEYLEFLCGHDIFRISYKGMLEEDLHYYSAHTVAVGMAVRLPALVYSATGKKKYLDASIRRIKQVLEKSVQITGSPVSTAEYLGAVGSITETEYCNYSYFNESYAYMGYITGEPQYGDLMEQIFYNGAQGARKKDEKAIAYLNAPNQLYATDSSSHEFSDYQVYAPCFPTACCPVASVTLVPEFIRGMLLHDDSGNIYVIAYGPCSLNYKGISIKEKTYYPFRNKVTFEINCNKSFALNLKIPSWCRGFNVSVNGGEYAAAPKNGYITVEKEWHQGDTVEIEFKAEIEIVKINDCDCAKKYPLAIKYGALVFAYHVPEIWIPIKGRPMTELPEGWSWYNVIPRENERNAATEPEDDHERFGLSRDYRAWHIALDENLKPEDIEIEELPENGYVWSSPMIKLHTHCYKAPYLWPLYPQKTYEPLEDYQYVTDKLELTLEPYGCTNLRITYFPKARLK